MIQPSEVGNGCNCSNNFAMPINLAFNFAHKTAYNYHLSNERVYKINCMTAYNKSRSEFLKRHIMVLSQWLSHYIK